jgi:hypothetical protein
MLIMAVVVAVGAAYLWYVRQGVTEPEQAIPSYFGLFAIPLCLLAVPLATLGLVVEASVWAITWWLDRRRNRGG